MFSKNISNFQEANALLSHLAPRGILSGGYNLSRMEKLMAYLGNPQNELKIVHVAGTSGKTSTAYFIAALLKEAGLTVGLTVSPHIDEVNERIQIGLEPMPEPEFCRSLTEFYEIVQKTKLQPTYFEFLVAMAYWYFHKKGVDYAVIEVGLGGRLDGTNVIDRKDKVCVITDIGMDHTEILGKTLADISEQKAGIITAGNEVFCHVQDDEIAEVVKRRAKQERAKLHVIEDPGNSIKFQHLPIYQRRNWELARAVFGYLSAKDGYKKLTENKYLKASRVLIPGRMEIVQYKNKTLVFDGAHNLQKTQALASAIRQRFPQDKIASLVALSKLYDHEATETIVQLSSFPQHIILSTFGGSQDIQKNPVDPHNVAEYLDQIGYTGQEIIEDPKQAFEALLKRPEPILVVTGSFFLLNTVRKFIKKEAR